MADNVETGWRVRHLGGRRLEWTTPTGDVHVTEPAGSDYLHVENVPRTAPKSEPAHEPFGAIICAPELRKRLIHKPGAVEKHLAELLDNEPARQTIIYEPEPRDGPDEPPF